MEYFNYGSQVLGYFCIQSRYLRPKTTMLHCSSVDNMRIQPTLLHAMAVNTVDIQQKKALHVHEIIYLSQIVWGEKYFEEKGSAEVSTNNSVLISTNSVLSQY